MAGGDRADRFTAVSGPHSIVVIPSLSGSTAESIAALAYCKQAGRDRDHADRRAGLAAGAVESDYNFSNAAADDTSSESFYLQSLMIALAVHARPRRVRRLSTPSWPSCGGCPSCWST